MDITSFILLSFFVENRMEKSRQNDGKNKEMRNKKTTRLQMRIQTKSYLFESPLGAHVFIKVLDVK